MDTSAFCRTNYFPGILLLLVGLLICLDNPQTAVNYGKTRIAATASRRTEVCPIVRLPITQIDLYVPVFLASKNG